MSDKLHIEQLIRSKLEKEELTPSPGSWKSIQRELQWKQFFRFHWGRFNIYYLGGLLLAGLGLVVIFSNFTPESDSALHNGNGDAIYQEPESDQDQATTDQPIRDRNNNEQPSEMDSGNMEEQSDQNAFQKESEGSINSHLAPPGEVGVATEKERSTGLVIREQIQQTMVTFFTPSIQSGCVPLGVQFQNQSVHAISNEWDFGTGEVSTERDPVYLFKEPGQYTVTLNARNSEGHSATQQQVIEVYPAPVADFQIEEGLEGIDGHVSLNLANYSTGANAYAWEMLKKDNTINKEWTSDEFQPAIKLADLNEGSEQIRLQVTSEYGCVHSVIQAIPIVVESSENKIKFPTAFSPNPTGPGGGSYSPHEKRRDLFHPVFIDVPVEFSLKIYTRRGELVFETMEIYKGWDGYLHEARAAGGVYVWMVEGVWENGEVFKLQGDVTLIWTGIW